MRSQRVVNRARSPLHSSNLQRAGKPPFQQPKKTKSFVFWVGISLKLPEDITAQNYVISVKVITLKQKYLTFLVNESK